MKIAIPLADGKLTAHFGHCREFALIEVEGNEITKKESLVPPPHEPGVLPAWLYNLGANVIIASGMGGRALNLFEQNGIKVVTGAPDGEPEVLVRSYLNNNQEATSNLGDLLRVEMMNLSNQSESQESEAGDGTEEGLQDLSDSSGTQEDLSSEKKSG